MTEPVQHAGAPPAEVDVTVDLVRGLLLGQHPDLAEAELVLSDSGWDNLTFRLGEELAVRLPRRQMAVQLALNEQAWLPILAISLPIPVPAPVRIGAPMGDYPFPWSIVPWLEGKTVDLAPLRSDQALPLVAFLEALHRPAPASAPTNPHRGVPLRFRSEATLERLQSLVTAGLIEAEFLDLWLRCVEAKDSLSPVWIHGDLHARNVLSDRGRLCGVIDWGDMCAGDPATDLDCIWMLLDDPNAREEAIRAYGSAEADIWLRAQGWAISIASLLLETGRSGDKRHAAMGAKTFANLRMDLLSTL
jgi:aminoglycoside phosphotransferase (APT) family kinase protein